MTEEVTWVNEPTEEDIKALEQRMRERQRQQTDTPLDAFSETLPEVKPVGEEANNYLAELDKPGRVIELSKLTCCYDTTCYLCDGDIAEWSEAFQGTDNQGQNIYLCGDRDDCISCRVIPQILAKACDSYEP